MAIIDKPSDYFNTVLYTGNASASRSITGVGFQPDWLWVKGRSTAYYHALWDVVRTNKSALYSNATNAEDTGTGGTLGSFNSDGFTLPNESGGFVNNNGTTYAAWNWKAGTSFTNDASATGIGTIDSSGSVNATAGFSIISFTGTETSSQSVAHGLGAVPELIISKSLAVADNWMVYHGSFSAQDYISLNTTAAKASASSVWTSLPTSTVINIGDNAGVNDNGAMIMYAFNSVQGYSKFGSYVGGGSNFPFIYTGFKPAFVMLKNTSATGGWLIADNKRDPENIVDKKIFANLSNAEGTDNVCDFLSNGFKLRTTDTSQNGSGNTIIYMCFASNPFVTSTGVPTTAR